MTTYPPAPLAWQNNLALDFTHSQIAYVGYEGTIFHLSGPFTPVLGAQAGAQIQNIAHIDPPFKHLDNKGARQDGTTWYDTLYDPAEIDMVVTLGATSPAEMRQIIGDWMGAWDPKQLGKLCWFSPERGEWVANVRMSKPIQDQFKYDWYTAKAVTFTWQCRNDDAFWRGPDSVCNFSIASNSFIDLFTETHATFLGGNWTQLNTGPGEIAQPSGTGASWVTSGTTTGTAIAQVSGGRAKSHFDDQFVSATLGASMPAPTNQVVTVTLTGATGGTFNLGYNGQVVLFGNNWNATGTDVQNNIQNMSSIGTGNVTVTGSAGGPYTITLVGALAGTDSNTWTVANHLTGTLPTVTATVTTHGKSAYVDIWSRMNTDSGTEGSNGVRARLGYGTVLLSIFNAGTQHDVWFGSFYQGTGVLGDTFTIQSGVTSPLQQGLEQFFTGTNWTPNQYQIYQNGQPLIPGGIIGAIENYFGLDFGYIDSSHFANVGPGYRGYGFGMSAAGTGSGQLVPPKITEFNGGAGTGYVTLTNIGDQPGWPRYLFYGPGTLLIGDINTGSMISFGPLLANQVALINTLPRLPGVVDLSPPTTANNTQLDFLTQLELDAQQFLESMINYVTNNNVPPFLQQFESLFGILPPQGPLDSLLSGRFTTALDPMKEQVGPQTTFIPCQIQGGNSQSKVIAATTPLRRWPE